MAQNPDEMSMQQRAMIITLALWERGRGCMSYPVDTKVTKEFWAELLCIVRWQSANQRTLEQIVAWGWVSESVGFAGTLFYALTEEGEMQAEKVIVGASRHAVDYIPQSARLFTLEDER